MKFTKPFYGCRAGEIYPEHFAAGDECPPELEAAAAESGVLEPAKALEPPTPAPVPKPEPEPAPEVAPAAEEEKAKPAKKAAK